MQFVAPKNDIAFKKIFGDEKHKNVLISFLNSILDFKNERKIKEVSITNPYQMPEIEELKNTILDIKAINQEGQEFIVEMQVERDRFFTKRSLYYSAKSYVNQIENAEAYRKLKKVYFIGILDFAIFENEDYISRHLILDKKTFNNELKDFEFTFIELSKFNLTLQECQDYATKWIYFIQNAENYEIIPQEYANIQEFKDAFEIASKYSWSKQELEVYDYMGLKEGARTGNMQDSIDEAMQEGMEKGMEKEKIEIAKNLLDILDNETISKKTNLDIELIQKLRQEQ